MMMDWEFLAVFLIIQCLLQLCLSDVSSPRLDEGSASKPEILQKVEGTVEVKEGTVSDDWMIETKVCLDGGVYCGFLKSSGDFVIRNVPPGSYLVEVMSPNFVFEPVRVDISSKSGKIRARKVNLLKSAEVTQVNYPLLFQAEKQAEFFEKRESWNIISTLKSPMVK